MKAGEIVICSHHHPGHGLMRYEWQCQWVVVQERQRIAIATLRTESTRFGAQPPKHDLAIPHAQWERLRELPCDLCGQPIGGTI